MEQNKQGSKAERKVGCEISRAIVLGSIAFFLGKQAVEEHSHRWTIYLRGLENEDLSYFISKVRVAVDPPLLSLLPGGLHAPSQLFTASCDR